jgi:hypothetical protein
VAWVWADAKAIPELLHKEVEFHVPQPLTGTDGMTFAHSVLV